MMITDEPHHAKLWTTLLFIVAGAMTVPSVSAQESVTPSPAANAEYVPTFTFDVASIRENKPSNSYTMTIAAQLHSSNFRVTSFSAMDLITMAYRIQRFQISDAPDWAYSTRFDIQAKSDSSVEEALAKLSDHQAQLEKRHMLQTLLSDRFQLKTHRGTKELPAFELTVMKNGSKLQETKVDPTSSEESTDAAHPKMPSLYQRGDGDRGYEFVAHGASMESIVEMLEEQFQTTVLDKTGLTGNYDFTLQYNDAVTNHSTDDDTAWPPLIKAIQERLGLKLQSTKAPVSILVIDHIEKPSEN
jgi:uncharacterized protein (TIGR03435 family)